MAGTTRHDLLTNAAVGNGAAVLVQGGEYAYMVDATFTGGSVELQVQDPKGNYISVPGSSVLANSMVLLKLPPGQYRAVSAGAVATASAWLITVPAITTR